ncbi:TIM-barrel domain-containing protein [Deinococcus wulumuqiensis]|uniref:glycoside hydrolase family 31 protein n=1 Tax=Deinococcus wulumuqiensis TaxID=980427 RepID=UPI00242F48F9|nr:TIM-barrel domain-containing protein [Deinococcus wulumuqiensis]
MTERFSQFEQSEGHLAVWGEQDALDISAPLSGVLRLRFLPDALYTTFRYPRPPRKESFAVLDHPPLPLEVERREGTLHVQGGGLTLQLQLQSGDWEVRDAAGHTLALGPVAEGHPDNATQRCTSVHRSTLHVHAPPDAAYLGFGEKVGPLDKRGRHLTFWNTDNFPTGIDTDPMYVSIPFTLVLCGGRASGLFVDEPWRMEVDVAGRDPERLTWQSAGPEMDLYVLAGDEPAAVVERYTTLTGRHALPPLWALGAAQSRWGYEHADHVRDVVEGFRIRELPLDAVYLDIDYMESYKVFTWNRQRFPDPAAFVQEMREQGIQIVPIVDAGVKAEPGYVPYEEALRDDLLVRTGRGDVLVGEVWPNPAVFPDFTQPDVRDWWAGKMRGLTDVGIRGVWTDMNEPACFQVAGAAPDSGEMSQAGAVLEGKTLPYDAQHGRRRHLEVHNAYALCMNRAVQAGLSAGHPGERPFVISRAGYAGQQRYAATWTGDNVSSWDHLALSVPMLCGLGVSGVALCGSDVGGFAGDTNGELLARWSQLGAFYPFMRNHSVRDVAMQEPWRFGPRWLEVIRAALHWRYELLPTLYTLMWQAHRTGAPILRPLPYHYPGDRAALGCNDKFLFGAGVLVAPVLRPGATGREVYLPAGDWFAFHNLQGKGERFSGPQTLRVDAGPDTIPVFLRGGHALALTTAAQHTTSANWPELTWHVAVGDEIHGELYEDAGNGDGPSRRTTLRGDWAGDTLTLRRREEGDLASGRQREQLYLYGLGEVQRVTGATHWQQEGPHLVLDLATDWQTLTLSGVRRD